MGSTFSRFSISYSEAEFELDIQSRTNDLVCSRQTAWINSFRRGHTRRSLLANLESSEECEALICCANSSAVSTTQPHFEHTNKPVYLCASTREPLIHSTDLARDFPAIMLLSIMSRFRGVI